MKEELILEHLEEIARKKSIIIRYEKLDNGELVIRSGGCRVKGSEYIMVDNKLPPREKIEVIAKELGKRNLNDIYMLPLIREIILKSGRPR
ncbi:MAG: hypothetical protein JSU92_08850 [Deltaproteobacteria bacterium]|nr:MAG: hypothetical protein JSU92_08850 [Deltaproteobacteria bacterium]